MTAADIATGTLAPTLTYAKRRWCWVPGGTDGRVGTLTIVLQAHERRGRRPAALEIGHYGILEDEDPGHPLPEGLRRFLLKKDNSDAGEVYCVIVGNGIASCGCKATVCKVDNCRHRDAMKALVEEGVI